MSDPIQLGLWMTYVGGAIVMFPSGRLRWRVLQIVVGVTLYSVAGYVAHGGMDDWLLPDEPQLPPVVERPLRAT